MQTAAAETADPDVPDVVVIGTGYVGLTCAACFSHLGLSVLGIDIDVEKVAALERCELPIFEAGLEPLVSEGLAAGRLQFTTSFEGLASARIVMLCLPTPAADNGTPDISILRDALTEIAPRLQAGAILVTKSTVPIGTHRHLRRWLDRDDVHLVSNPEFLREGSAVADFLTPDRVVIGAADPSIAQEVAKLYDQVETTTQLTDPLSAELIKYASNSFLATKLSFVNEIARLCDEVGADVDAVTTGLASDHRIGGAFLSPGPGWGGSCFPKDVRGLTHAARSSRLHMAVIEGATQSNREHFEYLTQRIRELCPVPLEEATIALWGLAFKAGTDDVRSSPAIELAAHLHAAHATVRAHDPIASTDSADISTGSIYEVCEQADMLIVATEWPEFATADMNKVKANLAHPVVFDTRAILDRAACQTAGLFHHRLGRPTIEPGD